jgi:hypothetical protein
LNEIKAPKQARIFIQNMYVRKTANPFAEVMLPFEGIEGIFSLPYLIPSYLKSAVLSDMVAE